MNLSALLAVILGLVLAAPAEDMAQTKLENWSQWRGPLASGYAPKAEPPIHWAPGKNIKWHAPIPGRGSASPIVWCDQVFVLTAVPTDRKADPAALPKVDPKFQKRTEAPPNYHQFLVMAFDRATGKLRWQQLANEAVPHEGHHPSHSYAAGSPTTDGRYLYVSFGSFGNYCYTLDGKLVWKRDLGRLNTRLGWGEAVTPVIHGDALLLNWDQEDSSALYCLDANSGEIRWRAARDEHTTWSTPAVIPYEGKFQVVLNGTNRIRSYDLSTGKELWECGGMTVNPIPSPVDGGNGLVYCMSGYQGSLALALPLGLTGDVTNQGKNLWKHGAGTPYVPSPLLVNDRLYFTKGNEVLVTVLDVKTGKPVIDRERLPTVKSFYASPVAAAGRVYLVDRDGTTLVLKQGDKLEVLATNRLEEPIDASPALVGKQLFLRSERSLFCIEE
jgi:outer membrane protein assembly factor BamB